MYLRIFFFGLIAITRAADNATVLLLSDKDHTPYVAFDDASCEPKCNQKVTVNTRTLNGFPLRPRGNVGFVIDAAPITTTTAPKLAAYKPKTTISGPLPRNPDEAASPIWISPMAAILKGAGTGGDGKVDAKCLDPTKKCPHPLAAMMRLTLGTLQTCHIIENVPDVYSFDFQSGSSAKPVHNQALASVAGLVYKTGAGSVELKLTTFGGTLGDAGTITLKPALCIDHPAGDPKAQCIDIFVGNISTDETPNNEIRGALVAEHFKDYFPLLSNPGSSSYFPFSQLPKGKHVTGSTIQPACRHNLPGVPELVIAEAVLGRKGKRDFVAAATPYSRPICPLATLEAP